MRLPVLLLSLLLAASAPAKAEDTARAWLDHMVEATQSLSYEGTFAYIQGEDVDVMSIVHSNRDGSERQRMYSLNGTVREVVVQGDEVICLLPHQRLAFKISKYERSPFPISFPRDLDALAKNYAFSLGEVDRVIDRKTQVVVIQPRDELRYGLRLWLDAETGLVLRSALVDIKGDFLEQLIFTRLQLKPRIDPARLAPVSGSLAGIQRVTGPTIKDPREQQPDWEVTGLPAGFIRVMYQWHQAQSFQQPTEQMVFSDGLATVSVFVERLTGEPLLQGPSRMNAMNAHGRVIDDRYQVIAVGEVPPETVAMIAASVRLTDTTD